MAFELIGFKINYSAFFFLNHFFLFWTLVWVFLGTGAVLFDIHEWILLGGLFQDGSLLPPVEKNWRSEWVLLCPASCMYLGNTDIAQESPTPGSHWLLEWVTVASLACASLPHRSYRVVFIALQWSGPSSRWWAPLARAVASCILRACYVGRECVQ